MKTGLALLVAALTVAAAAQQPATPPSMPGPGSK